MSAPTATPTRQELAELVSAILPGLHGSTARAATHTISPELWAALVTWGPNVPTSHVEFRLPTAAPSAMRRTLIDLLPEVPAAGILHVPGITSVSAAAPTHLVGAAKGAPVLTFAGEDESLVSVGSYISVTDELAEDVPQLTAWIKGWLRFLVALGEENEVIAGNGTAGHVTGFEARAIPNVAAGATIAAGLATAFGEIAAATGFLPDGIVLPAADFGTFMSESAADVDWSGDRGPTFLGAALIPSGAATDPLVGVFGLGAVLGRNGTVMVEGTQSHDLHFTKNLSAIRAASRITLGVIDLQMFRTVGA